MVVGSWSEWFLGGSYAPHAVCLLYDENMIAALALGDLLIFGAYMVIPVLLPRLFRMPRAYRPRLAMPLFAAFIISCGISHLIHTLALWWPIYRLLAVWTLWTGLVSTATVVVLLWAWHAMGNAVDAKATSDTQRLR
jgi:hypothetical protein